MKLIYFMIFLSVLSLIKAQAYYNYDNPNDWKGQFPNCNGNRQSPINLNQVNAVTEVNIPKLRFYNYDVLLSHPVKAFNNGRFVEVAIPNVLNGGRPSVSGGLVNDTYEVESFHFHWGSKDTKGSEHSINCKKYDAELHIVHKNSKFANLPEAAKHPTGILVLGILLKKHSCVNCTYFDVNDPQMWRTGLNAIYDVLPDLTHYNSMSFLRSPITMDSILSDLNTKQFYTYRGSLTTPPCDQAVTWIVFPDVLPIETRYIRRFWRLYDARNRSLLNNFRPVQTLRDHMLYYREGRNNQ